MNIEIVIPCHENDPLLLECLESILMQNHDNFGVCLVVDQSETKYYDSILEEESFGKLKIRILYQNGNSGITKASIAGFTSSRANWIAFVDQDDILHPDCLAVIQDQIERADVEVKAFFTTRSNFQDPKDLSPELMSRGRFEGWELGSNYENYFEASLAHTFLSHLKVFHRSLKLSDDSTLDGFQDWAWVAETLKTNRVIYLDQALYLHRIHPSQNSNSNVMLKRFEKIFWQAKLRDAKVFKLPEHIPFDAYRFVEDEKKGTSKFVSIYLDDFCCVTFHPNYVLALTDEHLEGGKANSLARVVLANSNIHIPNDEARDIPLGLFLDTNNIHSMRVFNVYGGLFDFVVPLDSLAELYSSFSGLKIVHIKDGEETIWPKEGGTSIFSPTNSNKLFALYFDNKQFFDVLLPIHSKRRILLKKLSKYL